MAADPHADVAPYALDALDDDEERAFEEHLASCERCREELAGLREATAALAYGAAGPAPPPELKQRILDQRAGRAPERRPAAAAPRAGRRRSPPRPRSPRPSRSAIGVWATTRPATSDAFASRARRSPARSSCRWATRGTLAVAPDGTAAVALTLPRAPAGKTYEAWVIRNGSGHAAPASSRGSAVARGSDGPVPRGSVVAVTLERAGGVDQPTEQAARRDARRSRDRC